MYSGLFAFFIASQIHSQVTPFASKDVEMRNPFEVQSGVLGGVLRILVSGGVVGAQYAKYDLVSYFPRLS